MTAHTPTARPLDQLNPHTPLDPTPTPLTPIGRMTFAEADASYELRRLAEVRRLGVLDTEPEARFDKVVRLAGRLLGVEGVAVNLVDQDRTFAVASMGLDKRENPREGSFCSVAIQQPTTLVVPDASMDPRFRDTPAVRGGLRFYAGQPLTGPAGYPIGALCVWGERARDLTAREQETLRTLGEWVSEELAEEAELGRASQIQDALLPRDVPDLYGYEVAGRCLPSHRVGGDFFDWYFVGDTLQINVADVMGKGVGAAIIGAGLRALLRGASRFNALEEAIVRAAASMENDFTATGAFATVWSGRLDPSTHTLQYVDAGHGLARILSPDGSIRQLASTGMPIGTVSSDRWTLHEDRLDPGEVLVCCSDGALDPFPDLEAAEAVLLRVAGRATSAEDLVQRLADLALVAAPADDVTFVALWRTPA